MAQPVCNQHQEKFLLAGAFSLAAAQSAYAHLQCVLTCEYTTCQHRVTWHVVHFGAV